jgi:hypothetical protein
MPLLDDSVQVIGETSSSSGFQATRPPSSPPSLAQLLQPTPLTSMSRDFLPRRTRILNFSIVLNDKTTVIAVTNSIYHFLFKNMFSTFSLI